jgi:hypothetical protein
MPLMLLSSAHHENRSMQQDGEIHKDVAVLDVIHVVLDIFVDKEGAIAAQSSKDRLAQVLTCNRRRSFSPYFSTMKGISGRGPTNDMLSSNTFNNCGSLSRLVFSKNLPKPLILGSLCVFGE